MNENINLCVILKDCPKGTKLYCPVIGWVEFKEVCEDDDTIQTYSDVVGDKKFSKDGQYFITQHFDDAECLLFPSKDQRDWSKWKCPKPKFDPKTLQPFDRVLVRFENTHYWDCSIFSNIYVQYKNHPFRCLGLCYKYCIPYNEDTKHLVGTENDAPEYYRYWED